jgi:hypothetical protein
LVDDSLACDIAMSMVDRELGLTAPRQRKPAKKLS